MKIDNTLLTIRADRYRCLRRLLREDDVQYLREAGFEKLARQKRAADRRAYLKIVRHLSRDMRRVSNARKEQMVRAGEINMEHFLRERLATEMQLQGLRVAAFLHFARVPAAVRMVDDVVATLERAFVVPTRVLAS